MGRMVEHFSSAGLRAFDTQAVQVQKKDSNALSIFLPFWNLGLCWNISDHHGTFKIILDYIGSCHNFRQFQAISDQFGPFQPIHDDFLVVFGPFPEHLRTSSGHFRQFPELLVTTFGPFIDHFESFPDISWPFLTISGRAKSLLNSFEQIGTLSPICWMGRDWTVSLNQLTIRAPLMRC